MSLVQIKFHTKSFVKIGRGHFKELFLFTRGNFSEELVIEVVEELFKEVTEKEDQKAVKVVEIQHNQV